MEAIVVYSLVLIFFLLFLLFIICVLYSASPIVISAPKPVYASATISDKAIYAVLALLFIGLYGYALFTLRRHVKPGAS